LRRPLSQEEKQRIKNSFADFVLHGVLSFEKTSPQPSPPFD